MSYAHPVHRGASRRDGLSPTRGREIRPAVNSSGTEASKVPFVASEAMGLPSIADRMLTVLGDTEELLQKLRMKSWERERPRGLRPSTVQPKPASPQAERRSIMTSTPKHRAPRGCHVDNASCITQGAMASLSPGAPDPSSDLGAFPKLLSPSARRRRKADLSNSDSPIAAAVARSNELLSMLASSKTLRSHEDTSSDGASPGCTQVLLDVICRRFRVGSATSNYPCHVEFFRDRAQYSFQHHKHQKISMCMFYEDMEAVVLHARGRLLEFRIPRPLEYFSQDYDCTEPKHLLAIHFETADDCAGFQAKVLPLIVSAQHASKHSLHDL